jgi:hypothetical protein
MELWIIMISEISQTEKDLSDVLSRLFKKNMEVDGDLLGKRKRIRAMVK